MNKIRATRVLITVGALVALILLLVAPGAALAADDSSLWRVYYADDNYSDGYKIAYPRNAWRGFDMTFYQGQVWQSFYPAGPTSNLQNNEVGIVITPQPADADPTDKPTHYMVAEEDLTWTNSDWRVHCDRLVVFRDRLFLYYSLSAGGQGYRLCQKELDGTNWDPDPVTVYNCPSGSESVRGLVVKVVNDTLVILFQKADSRDVYLITSTDAVDFSDPQRVHTFSANDCILNGDVVARPADGNPFLTFVTKDDAMGDPTGLMKMWTFDLGAQQVNPVFTFPNTYKDMVIVPGNVLNCTPYSANAIQVWAIGSGTNYLYHMQFVPNDSLTGGTCTDIDYAGGVSEHVEKGNRGYLAACPTAIPTTDPGSGYLSIDQRIRVWWWGSVNTLGTNAFGRSTEYKSDYLKNTGSTTTYFDTTEINDAWVLQGVITGLPPYYPNATEVGFLNANTLLQYGIEKVDDIKTTLKSGVTITVGFKSEFKHVGSVGFSCSNALERTTENEKTTEVSDSIFFGPDQQGEVPVEDGGMQLGAQAWGIFLVPDVVNARYEMYTPDRATYLDIDVNYTYIEANPSLVAKKYDMTQRDTKSVEESDTTFAYFQGDNFKLFPKSTDYWLWENDDPTYGTFVNIYDHPDYELMHVFAADNNVGVIVDPVHVYVDGDKKGWEFIKTEKNTESQKFTTTLKVDSEIFGFTAGLEGTIGVESSTSSAVGTDLRLDYGINGWTLDQLDENGDGITDEAERQVLKTYLGMIDFHMYWLQAKSQNAFFVPDGAKIGNALPWCITYHVDDYRTGAGSHTVLVGAVHQSVSTTPLPEGLRNALLSKLQAAKAAYQRGQVDTALNILMAVRNQIEAQSGKAIPEVRATLWLQVIDLIFEIKGGQ